MHPPGKEGKGPGIFFLWKIKSKNLWWCGGELLPLARETCIYVKTYTVVLEQLILQLVVKISLLRNRREWSLSVKLPILIPDQIVSYINRELSELLLIKSLYLSEAVSLSGTSGFPYSITSSLSLELSHSPLFSFTLFLSLTFDQVLFPQRLLCCQAWLHGGGLPFKCCFYCSTVTDHWPETGVAMEASTPCTNHTFPLILIEKVIFFPSVWNNKTAWQINLIWIHQNWALKTRISWARSDEQTAMPYFLCIIKGVYLNKLKGFCCRKSIFSQVVFLWAQYVVWQVHSI